MSAFANIFTLFQSAVSSGLKYPKITLQTPQGRPVAISRLGQMSRTPGHLALTDGGPFGRNQYYGRITPSGEFVSRGNEYEVRPLLQELNADPIAVATRYGKLTGRCMFCQLKLSDPQSVAHGYGPVCAKHYGLDHSKSSMKAEAPVDFRYTTDPGAPVIDVVATVDGDNDTVTAEEVAPKSVDEQREEALQAAIEILKASEAYKNFGRKPLSITEMRSLLQAHMQAYKAR